MENFDNEQIMQTKGIIESLLFVNEKPVTIDQIKKVLVTYSPADIKKIIQIIQKDYEEKKSGMTILEIAGGYQMLSNPNYVSYIRKFYKTKHKEKLSKPALETIAIIAYKQPVTRADIELIRSVNSDGVVNHLVSKELIKIIGRKDVPGRPYLYGTTKQFLEYFGLRSLDDLPKLEEFPALQQKNEEEINKIESENVEIDANQNVLEENVKEEDKKEEGQEGSDKVYQDNVSDDSAKVSSDDDSLVESSEEKIDA